MTLNEKNAIRKQYLDKVLALFNEEDVGLIASNKFNFPIVHNEEEGWIEITISLTKEDGDSGFAESLGFLISVSCYPAGYIPRKMDGRAGFIEFLPDGGEAIAGLHTVLILSGPYMGRCINLCGAFSRTDQYWSAVREKVVTGQYTENGRVSTEEKYDHGGGDFSSGAAAAEGRKRHRDARARADTPWTR